MFLTALTLENVPSLPIRIRVVMAQTRSGRSGEDKNVYHCWEANPCHPVRRTINRLNRLVITEQLSLRIEHERKKNNTVFLTTSFQVFAMVYLRSSLYWDVGWRRVVVVGGYLKFRDNIFVPSEKKWVLPGLLVRWSFWRHSNVDKQPANYAAWHPRRDKTLFQEIIVYVTNAKFHWNPVTIKRNAGWAPELVCTFSRSEMRNISAGNIMIPRIRKTTIWRKLLST